MRYTPNFFTLLIALLLSIGVSAVAEDIPIQSIDQAYARALANHPTIKAQGLRAEGLRALVDQANLIPNPALSVESENFSGSRDGFKETENTFALSQTIELGGKRGARTSLAKNKAELFDAKANLRLANLLRDVQIAYANVILSQKLFQLTKEQEQFTRKVLDTAKEKVKHGGILAGEQTKAEIALQVISIDRQKAKNQLDQSKRLLASYWNGTANDLGVLQELDYSENSSLSVPLLEQTLALKARSTQVSVSKSQVESERAQAIPDLMLSGGYRRFEETEDDAFVASFSIPLPFFNRNSGKITQAKKEVEASKAEYLRSETFLRAETDTLLQTREVLKRERSTILKHLLPSSEKALNQIRDAYKLGRVGYLDLIDSQQVYFGTKEREARNLFALKSNEATIKAITGEILAVIKETKDE